MVPPVVALRWERREEKASNEPHSVEERGDWAWRVEVAFLSLAAVA